MSVVLIERSVESIKFGNVVLGKVAPDGALSPCSHLLGCESLTGIDPDSTAIHHGILIDGNSLDSVVNGFTHSLRKSRILGQCQRHFVRK